MQELVIGVDLGGTNILYGVANLKGNILYKNTVPTNSAKGSNYVLNKLANIIETLIAEYEKSGQIKNIVIATPGPLSFPDKIVYNSPNLKWDEVAIQKEMQNRLNRSVIIEKDTNIAALGEYYFGQHKEYKNLIYITVSTGVGAGIIINGKLCRGANGGAAEIGHMVVKPNGDKCGCGRYGCLEAVASGTAIARQAQVKGLFPDSMENMGSREVGDLARQGNKLAIAILDEALDYLANGVANIVNIFNPDIVVLGGGVMEGLQDLWLDKLSEKVYNLAFPLNTRDLQIEVTKLGGDIGLYGCVGAIKN